MSTEELEKAKDNFAKAIGHLKIMCLCTSFTCKVAKVEEGFDDYNQIVRMALQLNRWVHKAGFDKFDEVDLEHELKMLRWHKENFPEMY